MCIKKVERFQADDGSLHETERDAIIANLHSLFAASGGDATVPVRVIVGNLSRVQSLLRQLSEPRNQRPRHEDIAPEAGAEELEKRYIEAQDTHGIDTRTFADVIPGVVNRDELSQATETITLDDLRIGQMVEVDTTDYDAASQPEYRTFMHAILDHFGDDKSEDAECIGLRQIVDGTPLSHWNALCKVSEINRILKQPEELLDRDEAQVEIEMLARQPELSSLDRKRQILLHRRIAEIEATEGATTHAASRD